MDGENNGKKPYEKMDDLGETPLFSGNIHTYIYIYVYIYKYLREAWLPP